MKDLKEMSAALENHPALREVLQDWCIKGEGREYRPKTQVEAFNLLGAIVRYGLQLYSPLELAKAWKTSKQNINNMLTRGHLLVLTWDRGTADYRYIVAAPAAADPAEAIDDSGWLQTVLPEPKAEAIAQARGEDDAVCGNTRCPSNAAASPGHCAVSVEHNYPVSGCNHYKAAGPEPAEEKHSGIDALLAKGFSRDEAKILMAGFDLVRYDRDEKTVWLAETEYTIEDGKGNWQRDPERDGTRWYKTGKSPYPTFAAAERAVKEILNDGASIEVGTDGHVVHCGNKDLRDDGFEFYRSEGIIPGHGQVPRIKSFSKGWGTVHKFTTPAECRAAWDTLMLTDNKALHG